MITKTDCINHIDDYLIYSGQDPEEWDVDEAASELLGWCWDNGTKPDEMDDDEFIEMLESHYNA